jgi:hypothetical protein
MIFELVNLPDCQQIKYIHRALVMLPVKSAYMVLIKWRNYCRAWRWLLDIAKTLKYKLSVPTTSDHIKVSTFYHFFINFQKIKSWMALKWEAENLIKKCFQLLIFKTIYFLDPSKSNQRNDSGIGLTTCRFSSHGSQSVVNQQASIRIYGSYEIS